MVPFLLLRFNPRSREKEGYKRVSGAGSEDGRPSGSRGRRVSRHESSRKDTLVVKRDYG